MSEDDAVTAAAEVSHRGGGGGGGGGGGDAQEEITEEDDSVNKKCCAYCGKHSSQAKRCCGSTYYCNRTCQKVHRKIHKEVCSSKNKVDVYTLIEQVDLYSFINKESILDIDDSFQFPSSDKIQELNECPICCMKMTIHDKFLASVYRPCCNRWFCRACDREAFEKSMNVNKFYNNCPFCQVPAYGTDQQRHTKIVQDVNKSERVPSAVYVLAVWHLNAGGITNDMVPTDITRGVKLLHLASKLNDPPATLCLGTTYLYGKWGIVKDQTKAKKLFSKAVRLGAIHGLYYLGKLEKQNYDTIRNRLAAGPPVGEIKKIVSRKDYQELCSSRDRFLRYHIAAARQGSKAAFENVLVLYKNQPSNDERQFHDVTIGKEQYIETKEAYIKVRKDMSSPMRIKIEKEDPHEQALDKYIMKHLKDIHVKEAKKAAGTKRKG